MEIKLLYIHQHFTIKEAIGVIDKGSAQIAVVVGEEQQLMGIITDGDIRRAILSCVSLDGKV